MFETIIFEKRNGTAYITLNRPPMNPVNTRMRDELYEVLPAVEDDPEILVAIIKGAGEKAFSAGADITEFGTVPSPVIGREIRWERDLCGLFLSIPKPLIAAVHGFALGAGIEMAMCCDFRIASEDARFGLPEVGIGMVPTAGGSQTMPRTIPRGIASHYILTGETLGAAEALRTGLVNRVVPRSQLLDAADELAGALMNRGQAAVRCAKEAIVRGLDLTLDLGLELEEYLFRAALADTARNG